MKTKKKNRFFTFCFSMLPGAGEMYMGFMKIGVSLMGLFFASIFFAAYLGAPLACVTAIVWFYGFFHANHLAGMPDEDFAIVKDQYLFGIEELNAGKGTVAKYQKWIAIGLIVLGIFFIWNVILGSLTSLVSHYSPLLTDILWSINDIVPRLVAGVLIILAGLKLISGKKKELTGETDPAATTTQEHNQEEANE